MVSMKHAAWRRASLARRFVAKNYTDPLTRVPERRGRRGTAITWHRMRQTGAAMRGACFTRTEGEQRRKAGSVAPASDRLLPTWNV